jgi:hypothetical protein
MVKRLIATSAGNKNAPKYLDRPYDADLAKAFPEIMQQLRKEFGQAPAKLVAAHTESIPAPKGERCIHVTGTVDSDGAGDRDTEFHFCSSSLTRYGTYEIRVSQALFPKTVSEQDRATFDAIEASFQSNMFLIAAQQEEAADMYIPEHHGGDVAARFSFVVRIHEMEEDSRARESAGWFGRFLMDHSVIHEVEDAGKQGAGWTRAAESWKRAYPYRIEDAPAEQASLVMFDSTK